MQARQSLAAVFYVRVAGLHYCLACCRCIATLQLAHLDEGDLRSKSCVHIRELQTNVPRANDSNPVWHPLQLQCMVAGEHLTPEDSVKSMSNAA